MRTLQQIMESLEQAISQRERAKTTNLPPATDPAMIGARVDIIMEALSRRPDHVFYDMHQEIDAYFEQFYQMDAIDLAYKEANRAPQ